MNVIELRCRERGVLNPDTPLLANAVLWHPLLSPLLPALMDRYLGVDLSGHSCGYAVVTDRGELLTAEHVLTKPKDPYWVRQSQVIRPIELLLGHTNLTAVVFEQIRLFHQGKISLPAIVDLARMAGVIGHLATKNGVAIVEVHTGKWRKQVLGDGRAKKEDVVRWAHSRFVFPVSEPPDTAEAVALAYYGYLINRPISTRRKGESNGGRRMARRRSR